MKRLLLLVIMASALILGACSKEAGVATTSGKAATKQAEVVKEKDDELIVEIDGKQEVFPAEIVKIGTTKTTSFPSFAKEVKVPKGSDVSVSKENGGVDVRYGGASLYVKRLDTDYSSEIHMRSFTQMMELSEPNKTVPVNELDLAQYPILEGYDGMLVAEGTEKKTYYLVREDGATTFETLIELPTSDKLPEKKLRTILKILTTIK